MNHKQELQICLRRRQKAIHTELTHIRTIMNIEERNLFNQDPSPKTGEQLRNEGIKQAEDHANMRYRPWSEEAYEFLLKFLVGHTEFLIEDVRREAEGIVPEPPSKRAWGSIAVRAAREGHIRKIGYRAVSNAKAHRTPATLWAKN